MGVLCNTESASSSCRRRRLKLTPQLCRYKLVVQIPFSFVGFGVFFSVRVIRLSAARSLTADLRGANWALLVAISTQQLLLRACISLVMDRIRSRNCSRTAVGNGPSTSDLGHESAQGCAEHCAGAVEARASICLEWSAIVAASAHPSQSSVFGVAVDLVAADVRQCSRDLPSVTGFTV